MPGISGTKSDIKLAFYFLFFSTWPSSVTLHNKFHLLFLELLIVRASKRCQLAFRFSHLSPFSRRSAHPGQTSQTTLTITKEGTFIFNSIASPPSSPLDLLP